MQIDAGVLAVVISLVAVCIAAYVAIKMYREGTAVTGQVMTTVLQESTLLATELAEVAQVGVQAAEQLYRTGKIDQNERFTNAFNYVKRWFPTIDQGTITTAIESAVLVVNSVIASLPQKEE